MKRIIALVVAALMLALVPMSVFADGASVKDIAQNGTHNVGEWGFDENKGQIWANSKDRQIAYLGNTNDFTLTLKIKFWGSNELAVLLAGEDVNGDEKIAEGDNYLLLWIGSDREVSLWAYENDTCITGPAAMVAFDTDVKDGLGVFDLGITYKNGELEVFTKPYTSADEINNNGYAAPVLDEMTSRGKYTVPTENRYGDTVTLWSRADLNFAWFEQPVLTDTTPTVTPDPTTPDPTTPDPTTPEVDPPVVPKTGDATAIGLLCSAVCLAAVSIVVAKKRAHD